MATKGPTKTGYDSPHGSNESGVIAPWDDVPAAHNDNIAPWDQDPQSQVIGTRPFNQLYFNDSVKSSRTNVVESPDFDGDQRRPSATSTNTGDGGNSKSNQQQQQQQHQQPQQPPNGRFRKSLKGFFGDDGPSDQPPQNQNGSLQARNNSVQTVEERPRTPQPASDVAPWDYQRFDDVKNYGAAPLRHEAQQDDSAKDTTTAHRGSIRQSFLHRHSKSREEPPKQQPPPPTSNPISNLKRPSVSRESSTSNLQRTTTNSTPQSSTTNLPPKSQPPASRKESSSQPEREKRGLFSKLKSVRHRDKNPPPPPAPVNTGPVLPPQEIQKGRIRTLSDKSQVESPSDKRDRETSVTSTGSTNTVKPVESHVPKMERTFTSSSKAKNVFHRNRNRGGTMQSDVSVKSESGPREDMDDSSAGLFRLDTNMLDMDGIISNQMQLPPTPGQDGGIFTGKIAQTPASEQGPPVWDAPDSWAIKGQDEEVLGQLPEVDEEGLPAIEEDDGVSYFMRVFRTDGTFATLSMTINATVEEVLQSLAKKSVLHDSIDNYQLLIQKHQLSRQLGPKERPIAMQKKLLQAAGYTERDHIGDIGREDNTYLCRFTFSHEKQTGYGSGLDNDPAFDKAQKFSHVDVSGKSLVTIPIILYTKAAEIVSLNISRNLALKVPKDFIQSCINLREIKFTGNEAWLLPPSLSSASRLTILDVSNNRLEQLDHAELHRLISLASLKLANNKLSQLPQKFSSFRQLRSLNLSSNNFTNFPSHICQLKSLVDLDISFNKLSHLPKIEELKALERLWVTNNDLKGPFSEGFRNLANLREVDCRFNGINSIDNLTGLPNLEQLLAGHNHISTFKGSFKKMRVLILDHCPITSFEIDAPVPSLTTLNIASAKLVEFKETMFDFIPNLLKLNLDKNHLSHMSSQIGRLTKLESFSMAKNPLNIIPPSVGNLVELRFLNLRECNLKILPPEIWYCKKLETLNVASNVLETFPKQNAAPPPDAAKDNTPLATPTLSHSPSFEELGKLEEFQMRRGSQASTGMLSVGSSPSQQGRKNSLASIQAASNRKMSTLTRTNTENSMGPVSRKDSNLSAVRLQNTFAGSLRYLSLADNRLEDDVFRELVMLPELRMLNLSYNELDDFPQGVLRRWPNMTELYLSGNELTSLPSDDLEEGSNLKILHLNANRFQVLPAELCKVHKLSVLDVGSNSLKYNVSNWPYDWNWNRNLNLKFLNFSANKRLEIKPAAHANQNQFNSMAGGDPTDLTSFNSLKYLRVLGLMDVTLLINNIPDDNEDRRIRTSASLAGAMTYGMADTLGRSDHLSTLDLLKPNYRGHDNEVLVGMFDGESMSSGGSKTAKYLHENFSVVFQDELAKCTSETENPIDALRRSFLSMNKDMANFANVNIDAREHKLATGPRSSSVTNILNPEDLNSGAVATILYIHGTDLYIANVGDIEAILIKSNGQHLQLTQKHDPAVSPERERIQDAGGFVSRQGKLNDALAVSRGFGFYNHTPAVNAAPHTLKCSLTESDELIVLATNELWNYVTVDVALDVARGEKDDLMLAAQKLRDLAISFGAREKIMVMVLGISDLRKRNQHRFKGASLSMARELGGDEGQIFPTRKTRQKGKTLDSKLARLEEPEAPIGDVAICFTDIKNSTALWEILPVPMRSAIMMHNELMRRQLRIIGGYEVKTEGDAFMVAFPTVTSALLWCFSCQSHLLELPWPSEILDTVHCQEKFDNEGNTIYKGLSVRMGVHWGRPVCEQDPITRRMDYFGPMVNKSARVSGVADGGQITASNDFISELQRTLESYVEEDRRDSIGSQDTVNDDPMGARIRRELRNLSSQGFEVKDLGEKKLKGIENSEFLYLMYPHSLAGRLMVGPGAGDKAMHMQPEGAAGEEKAQPGALGEDSVLQSGGLELDEIWKLWDLALRLEMLCSSLEKTSENSSGLKKPELSLLNRMKDKGGVVSDRFLLNLLEHQITRVEACVTTLQLRHIINPLQKGVSWTEQAKPIGDLLALIAQKFGR